MFRIFALLFCLTLTTPLWAACNGRDLIAELAPDQAALLAERTARHPYAEGLFWQAEKGDNKITLIGTMHLFDPRLNAIMTKITPALERADDVYMEMNPGDEERLKRAVNEDPSLLFITDGPTWPELLSPDDWHKLSTTLTGHGYPSFLTAKSKPIALISAFNAPPCIATSMRNGERGLDHLIATWLTTHGRSHHGLEDIMTLVEIFETLPQAGFVEDLIATLSETNTPTDQIVTLQESYFQQTPVAMWEYSILSTAKTKGITLAQAEEENAQFERDLITTRNQNWMDTILSAADGRNIVVAVGALHLPGENGLLNLLAAEGYDITRLP